MALLLPIEWTPLPTVALEAADNGNASNEVQAHCD